MTGSKLKTLDRIISKAGLGSRTEARAWIAAGRVQVNGRPVRTPDKWVNPDADDVTLDGKPVREGRKLYLVLYKPKGYITTYKDPAGRLTVYELLRDVKEWVFPVGRLDLDTSGLLLMTNDTAWADRITDPEYKVPKTYLVKVSPPLPEEKIDILRAGVTLSDGPTRPATVKRIRDSVSSTFLEMTITEGRNRQVRRMVEAAGGKVRKLVRVSIGPLTIGDLQIGTYRELTGREAAALKKAGAPPGYNKRQPGR